MKTNFLKYFCSIILLFSSSLLYAQKIMGTWEGYMTGEFIQININQQGNELCGYTYDYELKNKASHCIATFIGMYDPDKMMWYISGQKMIENGGGHVRMRIILWNVEEDGKNVLRGKVYTLSDAGFFVNGDDLMVRKVASKPQPSQFVMPVCFPKPVAPVTKKPATVSPAVPKSNPAISPEPANKPVPPTTIKPNKTEQVSKHSVQVPNETVKKVFPATNLPVLTQPDKEIIRKMNERKKNEQSRLEVNVRKIYLKVYDNGTIDNDTVSIFYNGKLLLSHQRLSETAIEIELTLDENISLHEITMYAENLGEIPPNTALIVLTAGDKRYELRSKASLEENAVLAIEYKPKISD